jgi:hypothetical protein
MSGLSINKGTCLGLILAGIGLMSAALFLHPMSPEDFLGAVLADPLQTLGDAQGSGLALLFWSSALVCVAGLAGLARHLFVSLHQTSHLNSRHRALAH